jgi:two-component system, LytTR family, sensor histidine kinase AlgZ
MARLELPTPNSPLLPREVIWLTPAAMAAATVLVVGLTKLQGPDALGRILSMVVPFAILGSATFAAYEWVMPALLARLSSPWQRMVLHLLVVGVISIGLGRAVFPLHHLLCNESVAPTEFVSVCVVITSLMVFPGLLFQAQRRRNQLMEYQLVLERQAALQAKLHALQARTNPHFFFNSVNTVAALISEDPVLAERTLERLADLFRYALDSANTRSVPLAKEFQMVRDYLAIQTARFGERLSIEVTLPDALSSTQVPPLLLQPLVENAVLHGLASRPRGTIRVTASQVAGALILEVVDDGPGPGASLHRGTQSSIKDLGQRLKLFWGEAAQLELERGAAGGCVARVAVPA